MATEEKWYFSKEQLDSTPSRLCGIDAYKELFYRQQAGNFIQDMGQRLKVSQLCINTAIVYMHRFYVFHSFTHFPWHSIAAAALFLAAKVEEQPRKLEHVIRVHNLCKNPRDSAFDVQSERYQAQSQDLVFNENVLLQTLGFDVAIDHPHAHVVRCCHLVRASKDLAQSSYFMASNSLHLTMMCLQYKPTVVACFCIHLACKWSNWEIPLSNEKKEWFSYVDPTVTSELLQQLAEEFFVIFDRCPSRLKEKIMAIGDTGVLSHTPSHIASPFETEPRKLHPPTDLKDPHHRLHHHEKGLEELHKHRSRPPHESSSNQHQREREYREKKERERAAQNSSSKPPPTATPATGTNPSNKTAPPPHQRPTTDPKMKSRPLSASGNHPTARLTENRGEILNVGGECNVQVRDNKVDLVKVNVTDNLQQSDNRASYDKQTQQLRSRQSFDPKQLPNKPLIKQEPPPPPTQTPDKKHANWYENKQMFYDKNATAHIKTPKVESKKSIPKIDSHNGNNNGNYNNQTVEPIETQYQPEKKRSMFSPEKTPPRKQIKTPPPPPIKQLISNNPPINQRSRTISNSSESELRPVVKKIDQVEGFENILRDSSIGIKNVPNSLLDAFIKEEAPIEESSVTQLVSIETNPLLISNLLKETPTVPSLTTIPPQIGESLDNKEHHHRDKKKKNKEKHKHRDKDKSKDDKEKKKKHRDKDKDKHRKERDKDPIIPQNTPIKITISKDKISQPELPLASVGLKIKIPKDRIKTEGIAETSTSSSALGIKIKIPKDIIGNMANEGKKRERDRNSSVDGPPHKLSKNRHSEKHNGRNSYTNKVAHMGDGDVSVHRLAESKYINKGAST